MKITKEMKVGQTLREHPETISIFLKYGLACAGCPMSEPENLEEAAVTHGMDPEEFIKELNDALEENDKA